MECIRYIETTMVMDSARFIVNKIKSVAKSTDKDIIIGLSGDDSLKELYVQLNSIMPKDIIPRLQFIQVDERIVADGSQNLITKSLPDLLIKGAKFVPMSENIDPLNPHSSDEYEKEMSTLFEKGYPALIILGVGDDGDIASIFTDREATQVDDKKKLVFITSKETNGYYRMSLSRHAIYTMSTVVFYIHGEYKNTVEQILDNDNAKKYPASEIYFNHKNSVVLTTE